MAELIRKVDGLSGPDREVDALIATVLEPHRFDAPGFTPKRPIPPFRYDPAEGAIRFEGGGIMDVRFFPPVTASIDAAMSLAISKLDTGAVDIEVSHRSVGGSVYGRAEICGPQCYGVAHHIRGGPAIALCIAILRAVENKDSGHE
ncbi:hypothetical protein SAZ10_02620 [Mesorhizobium sp. BAC0120]|uniref:hypothetical protein n=1 Tax=Mesorhizobium sp. BAC0120 TaxID=3090670 RepID=UPI00298C62B8|nr:hypothetical protein [Mesorhizobium sp. BAC0120]MDW6020651.1 hypothetical protein [Mesorhizobium sp. BAC0120]